MSFFHKFFSKPKDPKKIHIVFFGTPEFAAIVLEALLKESYTIRAVVTQPDKAAGRKRIVVPSPVKEVALRSSIPVLQPTKIGKDFLQVLSKYQPELILVAAYGKIFPAPLLDFPKHGCVNVHASLLPLYRGASPIQNAILNGEKMTGVSLMQLNKGLDTGPIYAKQIISLEDNELFPEVLDRLAHTAATLTINMLPTILKGDLMPIPQNDEEATVCQLIEKEDGRIYWNETAREVFNKYRAFFPWPGIYTHWKRGANILRIKLIRIQLREDVQVKEHAMGQVFLQESNVFVSTSLGCIELLEVQLEGKSVLNVHDFIRGSDEFIGSVLQ